jgi:hypothetical protein
VWKREEKKRTEIVELYFEKIILSSRLWNVYQIHSFLFENELSIWKKRNTDGSETRKSPYFGGTFI